MKTIILLLAMVVTAQADARSLSCADEAKASIRIVECTDNTYAVQKLHRYCDYDLDICIDDSWRPLAHCGIPIEVAREVKRLELEKLLPVRCPVQIKEPIVVVQ